MKKYYNNYGKIWLNVASSTSVLNDFVNIDNSIFLKMARLPRLSKIIVPRKYKKNVDEYEMLASKFVFLAHDCRKRLPFQKESVDHILCSHFLEHIYPSEADIVLKGFYEILLMGGTLHVIVPDVSVLALEYLCNTQNGDCGDADEFIKKTLLSRESRGSIKYRILEFIGAYGLQHRWMYDSASMSKKIRNAGFEILRDNQTPSNFYRINDNSVHVVCRK